MNLSWKEGWGCRVRYGIWAGVALMHWDADEVMVEICCGGIGGECEGEYCVPDQHQWLRFFFLKTSGW